MVVEDARPGFLSRSIRKYSAGVLALIVEHGLVRGERIGVDASTLEANAALRNIVRRDTGEDYQEMLAPDGGTKRH